MTATKLQINNQGDLEVVSNDQRPVKTIRLGSVGESINSDGQFFKLSYGKDLQGIPTIIAYATPEQKQNLDLSYGSSNISLTPDAVVTITNAGSNTTFQAGVLGAVTIDGQKVPNQSGWVLNSPSTTPSAPAEASVAVSTPTTEQASAPVSLNPATVSAPMNPTQSGNSFTKVDSLNGNVYLSSGGAPEVPLLTQSTIKVGDTIRTGVNGEAQISFFPDTYTAIDKSSKLIIKELSYSDFNNNPQRKLLAYLEFGNVYSKLNTKGKGVTDYQIQTPTHTFRATGTRFSISEANGYTIVCVIEGTITTASGEVIGPGYKGVFAANQAPIITQLTPDELFALNNILSTRNDIMLASTNDIFAQLQEAVNNEQSATFSPRLVPGEITPVTP